MQSFNIGDNVETTNRPIRRGKVINTDGKTIVRFSSELCRFGSRRGQWVEIRPEEYAVRLQFIKLMSDTKNENGRGDSAAQLCECGQSMERGYCYRCDVEGKEAFENFPDPSINLERSH
jgi:CDGSH-type Zn-finger protein